MTDMVTIGKWTIDLDNFDYKDFFVGKETKTVIVDGEEQEQDRWIYDHASYYEAISLKRDKEQREHKDKIIAAFTERGIVTAEISFSGGNDSGACDEHTFYDADGNKIDGINTHYISTSHNVDGKWVQRELTDEDKTHNAFISLIDAPIYWRWGSFAGEFSVYGTMYYDISPDADRDEFSTVDGTLDRGEYCKLEFQESSYEYGSSSF
jgi:hypothetical protein